MIKLKLIFLFLCAVFVWCDLKAQGNKITVGSIAPEIKLPTPKGESVSLSSLRGNLVLIDFWASWCAPCIEEQPELKKLYSKYSHSNGVVGKFEIFGVSLDSKKDAWEKSIRKLNIKWIQVSDLKFWTSPVAKAYDIQELPYNVLLDEKGVVLAINLHGVELERFVDSYLRGK